MNDHYASHSRPSNADYLCRYQQSLCNNYHLKNQIQYIHVRPRILTQDRILSVPTTSNLSHKSTHSSINQHIYQHYNQDYHDHVRLHRSRDWDNRYFMRKKMDIIHKSWDFLDTNMRTWSHENNTYSTDSSRIKTPVATYLPLIYTKRSSRLRDKSESYLKEKERRLKSVDANYVYGEHKLKRNKRYSKHNRLSIDKEIQTKPQASMVPPPAPPISDDLLKSIQQPTGIVNKIKIGKSTAKVNTYDAVVDELKNKLQSLKKTWNDENSALAYFDQFSSKTKKEHEKLKEPSFADILKQVQLKPSKKISVDKDKDIEKEDSLKNESLDVDETKTNKETESSDCSETIKIIEKNQTSNINLNKINCMNVQILNENTMDQHVTSFSTQNLFTKDFHHQKRDRDFYKNDYLNSSNKSTNTSPNYLPQIDFKYDVFKLLFSNSKLLKNKVNDYQVDLNNNCLYNDEIDNGNITFS